MAVSVVSGVVGTVVVEGEVVIEVVVVGGWVGGEVLGPVDCFRDGVPQAERSRIVRTASRFT
jgi:hypothetical protein